MMQLGIQALTSHEDCGLLSSHQKGHEQILKLHGSCMKFTPHHQHGHCSCLRHPAHVFQCHPVEHGSYMFGTFLKAAFTGPVIHKVSAF